jgi:hypothetical protein
MEDADREKIAALESRGFQVHLTRHAGGRSQLRFYCRVRSSQLDQSFYGETPGIALTKAIAGLKLADQE